MRPRLLAAFAAVAACALPAFAVILVPLSDRELAAHATHVFVATVTQSRESMQDPDGDGVSQPWTAITVRVEEVLKGPKKPGDLVTFRQIGGTVGQISLKPPGMPEFAPGERALLFLNDRLDNPIHTPLVGWAQGCWRVRDGAEGNPVAARDYSDSCFATLENGRLAAAPKPGTPEEPLGDLLGRFRDILSGGNK
jgi:hypothetical protein